MMTTQDLTLAARELERFRSTDADRAWRAYLTQRVELLKEHIITAEDRDAVAHSIKLLREILRETAAPPVRTKPQSVSQGY